MNNLEPDSYDKNDMQEKVNFLVRLHEAMHAKLKTASYLEPIQIPWYLINGLECTIQNILISLNTLFETLAKPAPKKGKAIITKTLHLVTNVFEDDSR